MAISVFACDHRQIQEWNLPFIRFGGDESICPIKCENRIFEYKVNPDETPKLFWLWKNLDQLGSDIIGYCQYRRFFTCLDVRMPLINIPEIAFKKEFALDPHIQESLIHDSNSDGILHPHFKVINELVTPYKYIWDQIRILEGEKNLQLKYQKLAFDLLLKHVSADMRDAMCKAFEVRENYLCNIFTAKKEVFREFGECAFAAVRDLLAVMSDSERSSIHPYWLAYLFERYTSCWYHAVEISGKYSFLKVPLLTIDAQNHIKWEPPHE